MALSLEEVRRIAQLARLRLSPEEERTFAGQLSAILDHVRQLEELDVSGVEPMTHALAAGEAGALRDDALVPGLAPDEALAAAPAREGTCFKVPRIIE
ncbi:MAG TPA: Asp-tRNA(Asn)/Glu-tRNA(Gln) amidotransferase subunit GatC [Anaeromyxobacteraceae bacterium]|nr:Asp-tRNA(Asn)/Glu-tRNA(Gln) amidotransferase subunit GatC [Anaeromyxobacteraceae bacterium]